MYLSSRLRAVSLFSWSVEQIARNTQMTPSREGARGERHDKRESLSSLSFSSDLVREVHAHASVERRSRETRETRTAAREEKRESLFCRASPVSRLQSRGWSFACFGRFARRTKKKERLFVVKNIYCTNLLPGVLPYPSLRSERERLLLHQ